ncbi:hypothetical protein B0H16DRAFT_1558718 [Mycena metata]|uniref:Uncharacterized protein n=1 Tax=Mycena metata TaxID=1033252 RepID=A0AAD7IMW0_9AGAR|nr:hypothetical protein B0H16DRAFT_1558718 [Mycena metata]
MPRLMGNAHSKLILPLFVFPNCLRGSRPNIVKSIKGSSLCTLLSFTRNSSRGSVNLGGATAPEALGFFTTVTASEAQEARFVLQVQGIGGRQEISSTSSRPSDDNVHLAAPSDFSIPLHRRSPRGIHSALQLTQLRRLLPFSFCRTPLSVILGALPPLEPNPLLSSFPLLQVVSGVEG